MRLRILPLFLLAIILGCSGSKTKQKVELKLRLQTGKTYRLSTKIIQEMEQTVHDTQQNIKTSLSGILSFHVRDRQKGKYFMDLSYQELHFKLEAPRMYVTFDSDKKPRAGNISDQIYARFVGKTFHAVIDQYGNIVSVTGIDSIGHSIVDGLKMDNAMLKMQLLENFKGLVGNRALKGDLAPYFSFYPPKPIPVGASWSRTLNMQTPIPGIIENTYTLVDFDSSAALIEGESTIGSLPDTASSGTSRNIKIEYDITGHQTSKIRVHPKDGWLKLATIEATIEGTMKVQKSPQIPHGLEIPFKIKTHGTCRAL